MQTVSVLGSTGCIGKKTVQLLLADLSIYNIEVLTANSNFELLAHQARLMKAKNVVITDEKFFKDLKESLSGTGINIEAGKAGLMMAASIAVDRAIVAIVGIAGLEPTMKIIESGTKIIALANKESIICGGKLMLEKAKKHKVKIIPVDSEHNAIFQIFRKSNNLEKIILTASGGPFLHLTYEQMKNATLNSSLNHPIWKMGTKISVDSATMMNKALELIEAQNLFEVDPCQLGVIVHPESVVHCVVSYKNGYSFVVLSDPDMDKPISYALLWPEEGSNIVNKPLDLTKQKLTFFEPNYNQFPALKLGMNVLHSSTPHVNSVVLNAANEVAVNAFVKSEIGFLDIVKVAEETLAATTNIIAVNSLNDIFNLDHNSRVLTKEIINKNSSSYIIDKQLCTIL